MTRWLNCYEGMCAFCKKRCGVAENRSGARRGIDLIGARMDGAARAVQSGLSSAGDRAAKIAGGVKESIDASQAERAARAVEEYMPKVAHARSRMAGTAGDAFVGRLGKSPLPLTEANAAKAKSSFPIPREQTVLWLDAEFDLRPSGIAATDEGVFIKSDARPLALPGQKETTQSRLFYFRWNYLEPAWFAGDGKENVALTVDPACSERFVSVCSELSAAQSRVSGLDLDGLEAGRYPEQNQKAAAVQAANALNAEEAVFAEQKAYRPDYQAGHGEMAEKANHMIDKALGHDAEWIGPGNERNGADRMVDGALVQTKYYKTARGSLESCFDPVTHQYRYMQDGKPMQLEVPKDQYERVLRGFERKIEQGKVPGVTDPAQAKDIVRQGKLTYEQAVNLTKPGTVESLAYDAATGVVTCGCAFGISFLATSFMSYRKTHDISSSVQAGVAAGVQVFGLSFAQHIVVSQLFRTGLADTLMAPSQAIVGQLGYRGSATIVNGLRALAGKKAISGAAASKQLAKIMRSNAVTAAVTFAIFSVPETYKLALGKATAAQYAQNMTSLAGSVVGGIGGAAAAGVAAAKIGAAAGTVVTPGVGTVVGVAGGFVGGAVGSIAVNAVGGIIYEGDGAGFSRFFNAVVSCMSVEYLLDEDEMNLLVKALNKTPDADFKRLMEETLPAERQEEKVRSFLRPRFEGVVSKREHYSLPTGGQIAEALAELAAGESV